MTWKVKKVAEVKWIKITTDMFDNRKIKHLRRMPDGDSIALIWVMLLTLAGRCNSNGLIFLTENIPYTPEMLADELNFSPATVILALEVLDRLGMIQTDSAGFLSISGWEDHQNIEGMEKIRESKRLAQARWRAKQKALPETATVETTVDSTEIQNNNADKNKKRKDKIREDKNISYSDDDSLNQAILSFIEFRKNIKKPMTDRAVELLIKKLDGMTDKTEEKIEILNQSIVNGWQGIFPLKGSENHVGKNQNGRLPTSSSQEYGTYL